MPTVAPGSSMMTGRRLPTFAFSSLALTSCWVFMKRCQRSSLTSGGTGLPSVVGGRALHRLVAEAADAVELRLLQPVEEEVDILLGLAGESRR